MPCIEMWPSFAVDAQSLTPKTGEDWTVDLSNDVKLEMVVLPPELLRWGAKRMNHFECLTKRFALLLDEGY